MTGAPVANRTQDPRDWLCRCEAWASDDVDACPDCGRERPAVAVRRGRVESPRAWRVTDAERVKAALDAAWQERDA